MRIFAYREPRGAESFADRVALVEDPSFTPRAPAFQSLRALSVAVQKADASWLAGALRRPAGVGFSLRSLDTKVKLPFQSGQAIAPPMRVRTKPLDSGLVHVVAVAESAYGQEEDQALTVLVPDGDEGAALYRRLSQARGIPMLSEWAGEVLFGLHAPRHARRPARRRARPASRARSTRPRLTRQRRS